MSFYNPDFVYMKKVIVETRQANTAPQIRSITVTSKGQSLIVAKLVKSYVAYVTNPKKAPEITAFNQDFFSIDGEMTKTTKPPINKR